MSYYVAAVSQSRQALWQRIFGQDVLPVLSPVPRLAECKGGSQLVYDLALDALHPMQLHRLAGWIAQQQRVAYSQALRRLTTRGMFIEASGVEVVTVVTADEPGVRRPFYVCVQTSKEGSWQRATSLRVTSASGRSRRSALTVGR